MFDFADLKRKVKNIVRITRVATPNEDGKALATVKIGDEESAEFPVVSFANSFKKHWIPIRKDEQVLVIYPFGNANKGYIFRGLFHKRLREPTGADGNTEIVEYEDGTRISYSTEDKELKITGECEIVIKVSSATIKADSVEIKSGSINLGGSGGVGVITEKSICPYTHAPHTQGSSVTKSI